MTHMPLEVSLFGLVARTYTAFIAAGVLIAGGWAVVRLRPGTLRTAARMIDICLCGLVAGLVCARIEHLALHWNYFSTMTLPPLEWLFPTREGGLTWHGAAIGGWIGLTVGARLFRWNARDLWRVFAPALPLIALGGWLGCAAEGCAYGLEVDTLAHFSPLVVAETRDIYGIIAPRFNTQMYGAALAISVGALMIGLHRINQPPARVLGIGLAVFSAGMCLIGVFRADEVPRWFGLRADQVLDVLLMAWGLVFALKTQS